MTQSRWIMMTLLWSARIANALHGGAMAENPGILAGSGVMLALSVAGLLLGQRAAGLRERGGE